MVDSRRVLAEPLLDVPPHGRQSCLLICLIIGLCFALLLSAGAQLPVVQEPAKLVVVAPQQQPQLRNRLQYSASAVAGQVDVSRRAFLTGLASSLVASRAQAAEEDASSGAMQQPSGEETVGNPPKETSSNPLVKKLLEKSLENKKKNDALRGLQSQQNFARNGLDSRQAVEFNTAVMKELDTIKESAKITTDTVV